MTTLDRELVDGELLVRPFVPEDRDALIAGRDEQFRRFLGEMADDPEPQPVACLCVDGAVIGWIDYDHGRAWLTDDEVNVGYSVFADHRRQGYGRRALLLLTAWLDARRPPLLATLLIDPTNQPSLALARRAGFVAAGEVDGELLFKAPSPTRHPADHT